MGERKMIEYVCSKCGAKYSTTGRHSRFCPECRRKHLKEYMSDYNRRTRTRALSPEEKDRKRESMNVARAFKRAKEREEKKQESEVLHSANEAIAQFSMKTLSCAKTKPSWCSDIRWRIELRRRKNAFYYRNFGDRCK